MWELRITLTEDPTHKGTPTSPLGNRLHNGKVGDKGRVLALSTVKERKKIEEQSSLSRPHEVK